MAKLKFPNDGPLEQDLFRNLNGDGGKVQMLIGMLVLAVISAVFGFALVVNEVTFQHFQFGLSVGRQ